MPSLFNVCLDVHTATLFVNTGLNLRFLSYKQHHSTQRKQTYTQTPISTAKTHVHLIVLNGVRFAVLAVTNVYVVISSPPIKCTILLIRTYFFKIRIVRLSKTW